MVSERTAIMAKPDMTMENGTCTIRLAGRIDSGNAAAVEADILAAGAQDPLVLDLDKLE